MTDEGQPLKTTERPEAAPYRSKQQAADGLGPIHAAKPHKNGPSAEIVRTWGFQRGVPFGDFCILFFIEKYVPARHERII